MSHLQNYDIFSSPYAQRFEDEQFVEKICEKFSRLLNGDLECGKLVYLLALVSPVKLDLEPQDVDLLKQFQKKISIMIYNYLMSRYEEEMYRNINKTILLVLSWTTRLCWRRCISWRRCWRTSTGVEKYFKTG